MGRPNDSIDSADSVLLHKVNTEEALCDRGLIHWSGHGWEYGTYIHLVKKV